MAVMIRGMEMPISCYGCEIRIKCGCKVANASGWLNNKIDNKCPFEFIEVPTPHGRLIDADELKIQVHLMNWGAKHYPDKFMDEVVHAPTIIEAEE